MSKNKGINCIGVSYTPPFYYHAGFSFAKTAKCLFLTKSLVLDPTKYPDHIWISSLAYSLFHISESNAAELEQFKSKNQNKQIQYLGLKKGVHYWQTCAIKNILFEEQINILGMAKGAIHVVELDVLAIWEYAFIKTTAPFKTRLVLWQKDPYLIGILGREAVLWKVWYWPLTTNFLSDIQNSAFPYPELITCLSQMRIQTLIPVETISTVIEKDYILAVALAYRGIRHAL